ncbi:MAG: DUF2088 domain-containing protein, partial [Anaerolineaceae bacterium]|nr:DUF2088 domain-containing protein [Anaerolineaceae bacterium]
MEFQIPYGHTSLRVSLPDHFRVKILESPNPLRIAQPQLAVQKALENLLGGQIWDNFRSARTVAIAVNDKTRPVPHAELLPPLLKRLSELGLPDSSITFYIAVGSHPPMAPTEFHAILPPEILQRYRVVSHNSEDQSLLM